LSYLFVKNEFDISTKITIEFINLIALWMMKCREKCKFIIDCYYSMLYIMSSYMRIHFYNAAPDMI